MSESDETNSDNLANWTDEQLRAARDKAAKKLAERENTVEARKAFEKQLDEMGDSEFNRLRGKFGNV